MPISIGRRYPSSGLPPLALAAQGGGRGHTCLLGDGGWFRRLRRDGAAVGPPGVVLLVVITAAPLLPPRGGQRPGCAPPLREGIVVLCERFFFHLLGRHLPGPLDHDLQGAVSVGGGGLSREVAVLHHHRRGGDHVGGRRLVVLLLVRRRRWRRILELR
eukprot:3118384-Pyramimonas_sp.AAC.1